MREQAQLEYYKFHFDLVTYSSRSVVYGGRFDVHLNDGHAQIDAQDIDIDEAEARYDGKRIAGRNTRQDISAPNSRQHLRSQRTCKI